MSDVYVKVTDDEASAEPIELPLESDGTIFLSSITAQFPGACGLKYRNPDTQTLRGLRLVDGVMYLPTSQQYWKDLTYIAVFPNKRKMNDTDGDASQRVQSKRPMQKCSDLIVLGLPWEITESQLESYFSKFGELVMTQIKLDENKKSKGFGFIRFSTYEAQKAACRERHNIQGRWCEVKIPHSVASNQNVSNPKIFVGRVTEKLSKGDLHDYFSQFGPVHDVYIPTPFRSFAFVTFEDPETAESLIGDDHIIKGVSVLISHPEPKRKQNDQKRPQQQDGYNNSGGGYNSYNNNRDNTNSYGSSGDSYNNGNNSYNNDYSNGGRQQQDRGGRGGYGNDWTPVKSTPKNNSNSNRGGGFHQRHQNSRGSYGQGDYNSFPSQQQQQQGNFNNPAMLAAAMNQWMSGGYPNY